MFVFTDAMTNLNSIIDGLDYPFFAPDVRIFFAVILAAGGNPVIEPAAYGAPAPSFSSLLGNPEEYVMNIYKRRA